MLIVTDKNWIVVYDSQAFSVISSQLRVHTEKNHSEFDEIEEADIFKIEIGFADRKIKFDESMLNRFDETRLNDFASFLHIATFGKSRAEIIIEVLKKQEEQ